MSYITMFHTKKAALRAAREYAEERTDYPEANAGTSFAAGTGYIAPFSRGDWDRNIRIEYITMVGEPTRIDGWSPGRYGGQRSHAYFGWPS